MNQILIYKHNQEHHFKIITYPDGQQSVELDLEYFNNPKLPIDIVCNIRNFRELEVLLCIIAALRKADHFIDNIYFLYLFGMRSDRAFSLGQPNYFRDILAPIINSINCKISLLYAHSLGSFKALSNAREGQLNWEETIKMYNLPTTNYVIGADESVRFETDCHFTKHRMENGEILVSLRQETINFINKNKDNSILIVDDLCDGGATFIRVANYLREKFAGRKIFLFIVHGLFTKGISHVADHYDHIFITNSYQDFEPHPKLTVIDVWN